MILKVQNAHCSPLELYKLFKKYGADAMNVVEGFAKISFADRTRGSKALTELDRFQMRGTKISVSELYSDERQQPVRISFSDKEPHSREKTEIIVLPCQKPYAQQCVSEKLMQRLEKHFWQNIKSNLKNLRAVTQNLVSTHNKDTISPQFPKLLQDRLQQSSVSLQAIFKTMEYEISSVLLKKQPGRATQQTPQESPFIKTSNSEVIYKGFEERICNYILNEARNPRKLLQGSHDQFYCAMKNGYLLSYNSKADRRDPSFCIKVDSYSKLYSLESFESVNGSTLLLAGTNHGAVKIVDTEDASLKQDEAIIHKESEVLEIKKFRGVDRQKNCFFSCPAQGAIKLWSVEDEERIAGEIDFDFKMHASFVSVTDFSSMDIMSQKQFVACCKNKKVMIFDINTRKARIHVLSQLPLKCVADSQQQLWLGTDRDIQLLDIRSRRVQMKYNVVATHIRGLAKIQTNKNLICYGGIKLGMLDKRVNGRPLWLETSCARRDTKDMIVTEAGSLIVADQNLGVQNLTPCRA